MCEAAAAAELRSLDPLPRLGSARLGLGSASARARIGSDRIGTAGQSAAPRLVVDFVSGAAAAVSGLLSAAAAGRLGARRRKDGRGSSEQSVCGLERSATCCTRSAEEAAGGDLRLPGRLRNQRGEEALLQEGAWSSRIRTSDSQRVPHVDVSAGCCFSSAGNFKNLLP